MGVFTTLKQQYETTKIEEVKESNHVIVLDYPELPIDRFKPNKRRFVLISGLLGVVLAIISCFLIEYFKKVPKKNLLKIKRAREIIFKKLFYK